MKKIRISSFIVSVAMVMTIGSAYAANPSIEMRNGNVYVSGIHEDSTGAPIAYDYIYMMVVNQDASSTDSRNKIRYFKKDKTDSVGAYDFEFYAADGGNYKFTFTNNSGDYTYSTQYRVANPVLNISGGGVVGRKINVIYELPTATIGSNGVIRLNFNSSELEKYADNYVDAQGCTISNLNYAAGSITMNYSISDTSVLPKIYISLKTVEGYANSENNVTITTDAFTLENSYGDSISCDYRYADDIAVTNNNAVITLIGSAEYEAALNAVKALIAELPATSDIKGATYSSILNKVDEIDNAIRAAEAYGADTSNTADFDASDMTKLTEVKAKLSQMKPIMDILFELNAKTGQARYDFAKEKKTEIGISDALITSIDAITDTTIKNYVFSDFSLKSFYEKEDVVEALSTSVLLRLMKITEAKDVNTLLNSFNSLFNNQIFALSDTACTVLEKREYKTLDDLKTAINNATNTTEVNPGVDDTTTGNNTTSKPRPVTGGNDGGGGTDDNEPSTSPDDTTTTDPPVSTGTYSDLYDAKWAAEFILRLNNLGIIDGYEDNTVRPNNDVTRAEFIKMLVETLGLELVETQEIVFTDVTPDKWYYKYVMTAYKNKIISGKTDTFLGAADVLSRQDMMVIIYRALNLDANISYTNFIDDNDISDYAKVAVRTMVDKGYVNGFEDNSFRPFDNTSRAMAAKILCAIIDEIQEGEV